MSNIDDKIVFEPTGFEYQNTKAKVVIVGITPGNSQLKGDREGLDLREHQGLVPVFTNNAKGTCE
jgi:hypothetical protein